MIDSLKTHDRSSLQHYLTDQRGVITSAAIITGGFSDGHHIAMVPHDM